MRPTLFWLKILTFGLCWLLTTQLLAQVQETVLVLHPKVGEVIDLEEKTRYKLFPFYPDETFMVARFLQHDGGEITLEVIFKNGRTERRPYTQNEFTLTRQLIEVQNAPELKATTPAPAITTPAQQATVPSAIPEVSNVELKGKVYYLILNNGMKFFATIAEKQNQEYVFNLSNGTLLAVPFKTIRYMRETDPKLHHGVYWIPALHDSRMYFGPTGRGLKEGDGYVQDINLFIISASYGLTDRISIGGMSTIVPFLPLEDQIISFTPKLSVPISKKFGAAGGVLIASVVGNSFGIVYGAGTYGNSDSYLTGGLGYGFVNKSFSSTPVIMFGGVARVSNRVALMSENYIVPGTLDDNTTSSDQFSSFGLYGVRFIWPSINFDLGAAYLADNYSAGSTYILPVFYGLTVKFGNRKIIGKVK